MSKIAVIDLGTNTFHLLIAGTGDGRPAVLFQETIAVKLGEGGITEGIIPVPAFERGLKALHTFHEMIRQFQPDLVKGVATSAIRSASNGGEFISTVLSETGIQIEIIDGNQEAELIYKGVRQAVAIKEVSLIVDIGGGSVEFIIANKNRILWKKSYPLGAARLMDRFHHSDPISETEIVKLHILLSNEFQDLRDALVRFKPSLMIGSAGSFETFAELEDQNYQTSFDQPQFHFNLQQFRKITDTIIRSTHSERLAMDKIVTVRKDMIVVAAILARYILDLSDISALKMSSYSLKEGLLFDSSDGRHKISGL